jgi:hypothetical protein
MAGRKKGLYHPEEYTYIGKYGLHKENFFKRLIEDDNGCLLWSGGTHNQGYGMVSVYNTALNKRQMNVAHRMAMMIELDRELGSKEFVVHEFCDNQLCCNPAHMIVGDATDRNRVQYAKGRRPTKHKSGEQIKKQNRAYKYTDDEMRLMRDGTIEAITDYFKVSKSAASHMKHRMKKGYKWLV